MHEIDVIMQKYAYAKQMLETEIDIMIKEFAFQHHYNPVEHIKSRLKENRSIMGKLAKKNVPYTAENIIKYVDDVIGIRIVCSFLTDVYDIVGLFLQSKNIVVKERKDYIAFPKDTGYSSYHLIVLVPLYLQNRVEYMEAEIQIRTVAMDFWASLDHKIQYKFEGEIPSEVKETMKNYSLTIKELDKQMLSLNEIVAKYKKDL